MSSKAEVAATVVTLKVKETGEGLELPLLVVLGAWEPALAVFSSAEGKELYG